jgi:hypothetical protein
MNMNNSSEDSQLLPTISDEEAYDNVNYSNRSHGRESEASTSSRFTTSRKSVDSFTQMKRSTHNDQISSKEYERIEDFQKLLGSTSMLRNAINQKTNNPSFTKKTRSQSLGMLFSLGEDYQEPRKVSGHTMFENGRQNSINSLNEENSRGENGKVNGSNDSGSRVFTRMSMLYNSQIKNPTTLYLQKIKTNFFEDAKSLAEGTIPQSIVLAIIIGIVCGIACYLYYTILFWLLDYLWTVLPQQYVVGVWPEHLYWLWIPLISFSMVTLVGLTVVYMGEPGDLPYTISRVHAEAYIPMNHVTPMVFASMFSILGK